jgi:hypothetical protein
MSYNENMQSPNFLNVNHSDWSHLNVGLFGVLKESYTDRLNQQFLIDDELIHKLLVNDLDIVKNYKIIEDKKMIFQLGEPTDCVIISGDEWTIEKLFWDIPDGRIIHFNVVKNVIFDESIMINENQLNLRLIQNNISVAPISIDDLLSEVSSYNDIYLNFTNKLDEATTNEDYSKAIELRDWKSEFEIFYESFLMEVKTYYEDRDFDNLSGILSELNLRILELNEIY